MAKDKSSNTDKQIKRAQPRGGKVGETPEEKRGKKADAQKIRKKGGPDGSSTGPESSMARQPKWEPRYPGSGRLKDKVAIVTGGDSGIGRAVAALYAREGAKVAVVYHTQQADADETVRIVEAEGSEGVAMQADVGDAKACAKLVKAVVKRWGSIDVLVNNAGEQHPAEDIRAITQEQLEGTFRTNIFGMFYLVQAALEHLKEGSAIVNCGSITSFRGSENLLDYSATKGAIAAFTRSLAANLAEKGIRVNGVAPGPIWTPLNPMGGADADKVESFGEDTPMKRPGEPNEVAPCFLFLACDDSSYMSGQMLHPNGGTSIGG